MYDVSLIIQPNIPNNTLYEIFSDGIFIIEELWSFSIENYSLLAEPDYLNLSFPLPSLIQPMISAIYQRREMGSDFNCVVCEEAWSIGQENRLLCFLPLRFIGWLDNLTHGPSIIDKLGDQTWCCLPSAQARNVNINIPHTLTQCTL